MTYECCFSCPKVSKRDTWKGIAISENNRKRNWGFVDANWPRSIEDGRSTSGYCTKVCENVTTWRSKK